MSGLNYYEIFNTPWGLDEDLQSQILTLDLLPHSFDNPGFFTPVFGDMDQCPLCFKKLLIPKDALDAMCKGDDTFLFDSKVKKKIKYHCIKYHSQAFLWPVTPANPKIESDQVSVIFMAQKLLTIASKKPKLADFIDIKIYISTVFGIALGLLQSYSSNTLFGANRGERVAFFDEVDIFLNELLHASMKFQWELLFQLNDSKFSLINFLQNFWRVGLFFEPRFPSFQEIDLGIKMTILCNYKRKKQVMIPEVDMIEEEATEPLDEEEATEPLDEEEATEPLDEEEATEPLDEDEATEPLDEEEATEPLDEEEATEPLDDMFENNLENLELNNNIESNEVEVEVEYEDEAEAETEAVLENPMVPIHGVVAVIEDVVLAEGNVEIVPVTFCATRHFPEDATKVLYSELFYKNKDLVGAVGSSTYGEINKAGVYKLIDCIHVYFFKFLSPEEKSNFQMVDVGAGLMTSLVHIAQEIEGQYCGLEICPTRARLFALSYKRLLATNVLHNTKVAFVWDDVKNVTSFDFDLVYAFDETMDPYSWMHMMEVFKNSPRCKFLISFKTQKDILGNINDFRHMVDDYELDCVHTEKVRMKMKPEICSAGFFVKDSIKNRIMPTVSDVTGTIHEGGYPSWSNLFQEWNSTNRVALLHNLIQEIDQSQEKEKSKRSLTKKRKAKDNFISY
jgi:hypothetical protein